MTEVKLSSILSIDNDKMRFIFMLDGQAYSVPGQPDAKIGYPELKGYDVSVDGIIIDHLSTEPGEASGHGWLRMD